MLLIKNGRVMDPKTGLDQVCDVLIEEGKIIKIAPEIKEEGAEIIDASGLVVAPGLVDIHVHFREPGQTHKEDIPHRCPCSRCRWFYYCRYDG